MSGNSALPSSTSILVIGAGVVGCSAAYHLAEQGCEDVTVVDMGDIEAPGGSTVHAPGGLVETSSSKVMSEFATYSRRLYSDLDAYRSDGLIELATSEPRWQQAKRLHDYSRSWDIPDGELLSPSEVGDHVPLIDEDTIQGGFYSPKSGLIRPIELLAGLRERAVAGGATFHGETKVTDIEVERGEVTAVETDRGRVEADQVLVAANNWAPLFGRMVGVDIPLMPCEHQYAVTESLPELAGTTSEVEFTGFRHQDAALYFRQHGEGYGIGSYNHEPLLVEPDDLDDYESGVDDVPVYDYFVGNESNRDPIRMTANREFTPEHFEAPWEDATRVMPALDGADLEKAFNGIFCFTPDGMPVMGTPPDLDGFWVAAAVWLTHAGGVGKAMAEWMADGYPRQNLVPCDINRFQNHAGSPRFVHDRAAYSYDTVYDLTHPRQIPDVNQNLRTGPFYDRQVDLGAECYPAAGWERARWYDHNEGLLDEYDVPDRSGWEAQYWSPVEGAEHLAVRDRVGLFDLSAFTNIVVSGPDALEAVQRVCTNDMDVGVGDVTYTLMCNENGGILGDMTVVREARDRFQVLGNSGAAGTEQLARVRRTVEEFDATVTAPVAGRCAVGVWGPDARDMLAPITATDLGDDAFPYFTAQDTYVEEVPVTAIRVSYVGELGWELHTTTDYGRKLWNTLWEAGREYDAVPMGDGALNTMRLEKGYPLFGGDITPEYDPYEAGLGFTVDVDTEFVGRDALVDAEPDRKRVTLTLDEPGDVVFNGAPVFDGETQLGYAAGAGYGHSVGAGIVTSYLPVEYADPGTSVQVQYETERHPATVRESPLFDPERERLLG
jgi:glycine cleavage system aminomethyltransferase T/glycine/D-amino acid oxidase-like deaminating enzyme